MNKYKNFSLMLIPSATVFFSSGCIMVLELVAGRLVARHLGSSLYTWTSVIGVVLAGISIGNYLGGRIADRFPARKALSLLFGISSAACVGTVILNNVVGELMFLWYLRWPLQVFSHVCLVFLIPSIFLGTISPVVAKMALDQGLPTGRTVGDIYAWGAAGSIAGTFLAGFYLIALMGTIAIIWTVGTALLLLAVLFWVRLKALYLWAAIFVTLMIMGMAPAKWAESTGSLLALRKMSLPDILYEDETQYNYIAVYQLSSKPDKRKFVQDKLTHSVIIMNDIRNLEYNYELIYAAITHRLSQDKDKLSVLGIGGGGYVFPRYIEDVWPGSRIDVAEIDPGVTKAAMQAFGLENNTSINIFAMDARNYVDELVKKEHTGEQIHKYDFIYGDAFNHYSVPYQLVTQEFNEKIAQILKDDGVYMVNVIDIYNSGLFLGAVVNTLQQTFPNVYLLSEVMPRNMHNTFVVVAAKQRLNLEGLINQCHKDIDIWHLNDTEINTLKQKAQGIILTDDYVPVENLLAPVTHQMTVDYIVQKCREMAEKLKRQGKFDESITAYKAMTKFRPTESISAYSEIAKILEKQGKLNEAVEVIGQVVKYNEQAEIKFNIAEVHLNLALLLKKLGKSEQSKQHFLKAIEEFQKNLAKNPNSFDANNGLGIALDNLGQFND